MAYREKTKIVIPVLSYLLILIIFYFFFSIDQRLILEAFPVFTWISVLIASLFAINELFVNESRSGYLEQMSIVLDARLLVIIYSKVISSWILTFLPILVVTIITNFLFGTVSIGQKEIYISLLLGNLILFFIGAMIRCIILKINESIFLLPLLLIPLFVPVLIIGVSCFLIVQGGESALGQLSLLSAIAIMVLTFTPFVMVYTLRSPIT